MTSVLNVDTIAAKDGTSPVGLTKQSAAKAWANHNNTGTVAVNASFNVSSLSDSGTGGGQLSFSNAMSDAYYSATHGGNQTGSQTAMGGVEDNIFTGTQAASSVYVIQANGGSATDFVSVNTTVNGDLA